MKHHEKGQSTDLIRSPIHPSIPEILLKTNSQGVECSQGPLANDKISLSRTGHPSLLQVFAWMVLFLTHKNQVSSGEETEAVPVRRSSRTAQLDSIEPRVGSHTDPC